jgi:hypothetical protein
METDRGNQGREAASTEATFIFLGRGWKNEPSAAERWATSVLAVRDGGLQALGARFLALAESTMAKCLSWFLSLMIQREATSLCPLLLLD